MHRELSAHLWLLVAIGVAALEPRAGTRTLHLLAYASIPRGAFAKEVLNVIFDAEPDYIATLDSSQLVKLMKRLLLAEARLTGGPVEGHERTTSNHCA